MKKAPINRFWATYLRAVEDGEIVSLSELGLPVGPRKRRGFAPTQGDEAQAQAVVDRLVALWNVKQGNDANSVEDERKIVDLGAAFLEAVEYGDLERAREVLDAGFPVNFQHPVKKEAALHIASSKAELNGFTEELLDRGDCDLLLRDQFGRLAWNNAVFFNPDSDALIDRLARETSVMATKEGIDLLAEDARYRQQWFTQSWFLRLGQRAEYAPE